MTVGDDDSDVWAGAYGVTVGLVALVGYWLNGPAGFWYALCGVMVLSVVTWVVWVVVGFTLGIVEAGGDPVVVYGCLVIAGAVVGLLVVSGWVLATGVAVGLLVGLWQWSAAGGGTPRVRGRTARSPVRYTRCLTGLRSAFTGSQHPAEAFC